MGQEGQLAVPLRVREHRRVHSAGPHPPIDRMVEGLEQAWDSTSEISCNFSRQRWETEIGGKRFNPGACPGAVALHACLIVLKGADNQRPIVEPGVSKHGHHPGQSVLTFSALFTDIASC